MFNEGKLVLSQVRLGISSWLDNFISVSTKILLSAKAQDLIFYGSFVILCCLMVLPIWQVSYLPLADLPDHASQIEVMRHYDLYKNDYQINWVTPYIIGYGVTLLFSLLFPISVAIQIVLSLSLLAIPLAALWLIRLLRGNRFWVWIIFPAAYSFSFYWGFYSYVVATPIALFTIAYSVKISSKPLSYDLVIKTSLLSLLLFSAHAMAWFVAMVIAPFVLWLNNPVKDAIKKYFAFVGIAPVVGAWLMKLSGGNSVQIEAGRHLEFYFTKGQEIFNYVWNDFVLRGGEGNHALRIKELFSVSIGMPIAWDYVALTIFLILWPKLIGAKFRLNPKYWLPLIAVFTVFMIIPYWLFDTAYVYSRFSFFLLPAVFFLYRLKEKPDDGSAPASLELGRIVFYLAGFMIVVGLLWGVNQNFRKLKPSDRDFKAVLAHMEPNKTILSLISYGDSPFAFSPAYSHFGSWYQASKGGVTIANFAHDLSLHSFPVRYRHQVWPIPSTWDPRSFDWEVHQGSRYDYFLIRAQARQDEMFRAAPYPIVLLVNEGDWYLYGPKR
jgi:hypothetical protein